MRGTTDHELLERFWARAAKQHGVVARRQLVAMGFTRKGIEWALATGRLHRTERRGVYALSRGGLSEHGRLMAALLWAGPGAVLSHESAADLWRIRRQRDRTIALSVPAVRKPRSSGGVTVHRRRRMRGRDLTRHYGIPITKPVRTLVDLATVASRDEVERAIGQADARNLVRADSLREQLERVAGPGVRLVRDILDRDAFVLTHSDLERRFVRLAARAGLPKPQSQRQMGRARVDFYWPELNLVVECDSLRYHRTQLQQAEDRARDHAHRLTGRERERLTHYQVRHEPDHAVAVLRASSRCARAAGGPPSRGRSSGSRPRSSA